MKEDELEEKFTEAHKKHKEKKKNAPKDKALRKIQEKEESIKNIRKSMNLKDAFIKIK
jgi:hypothetical protein